MTRGHTDKSTCRNSRFGQERGLTVGELDVHNPRTSLGKKVMAWDFKPVGTEKSYVIDVAYHLDDDGGMYFKATNDEIGLSQTDSDIELLRRSVEAELMLISVDIKSMQWEDWLAVGVSGSGSHFNDNKYTGMGAELKVEVQRLKRGWHEPTQRFVTIGRSGFVTNFPEPTQYVARETTSINDMEWLTGRAKPQTAYIPDTPENMAALTDIQTRLAALQDRLMALLHQDAILESMARLDSLLLPSAAAN